MLGAALAVLASITTGASSGSRMTSMSFNFPEKRTYQYDYDDASNTVIITFDNTIPSDLSTLDHYDENLIKRVVIKEHSQSKTTIRLTLKDRNLRASIAHFDEPYRIVLDVFDYNFQERRDPITGLPLSSNTANVVRENSTVTGQKYQLARPSEAEPTTTNSDETGHKLRLLQPTPKAIHSPTELADTLEKVPPGIGPYWKQFPPYIYRLQTASYHDSKSKKSWHKTQASKALSSSKAMAEYASKLYDFGHENRALVAFQQTLHQNSQVLAKNPTYLWKIAEIHLGQGNFTLADGYYQTLIEKHQEHPLANFAKLRQLDVKAIGYTNKHQNDRFEELAKAVDNLSFTTPPELLAQKMIRDAYWSRNPSASKNDNDIPSINKNSENSLAELLKNAEGQKTIFIASSIILNSKLEDSRPWKTETGIFATNYLKAFSGPVTEPYRSILVEKIKAKLNKHLQDHEIAGKYIDVIDTFESLSPVLKTVAQNTHTAWALGQSYRKISQPENAIKYYQQSAKEFPSGVNKFKANFWLAVTSGEVRNQLKANSSNPSRISYLGQISRSADSEMEDEWKKLDTDNKTKIMLGMRDDFEHSITSSSLLKTPALILLEAWDKSLSSTYSAGSTKPTDILSNYSPIASTVTVLTELAKRFSDLGLNSERRKTIQLLRYIKPSDIKDEKEAKKLWADQLIGLADEYREDSQYLEAGRLYAFTGEQAPDFEQRAATLYKGGLMLYRAGRSEEAIKAFTQCSEDGQDRYYANLCTERLSRINNQQ